VVITLPVSEKAFQLKVVQYAYLKGWHVAHFTPAKVRENVWVTPQTGHTGFPDLVLARRGVVLFLELKTERGVATDGQKAWLTELGELGRLYRPSDWDKIMIDLG